VVRFERIGGVIFCDDDTLYKLTFTLNPVHTGDKVEFNMVDFVESRLLPQPATNRQQSRLLPYTFNFVVDTVDIVATVYGANTTQSKSTVLNSTLSPVCTGLKYPENYGQIRNAARATWFRLQNKQWHNN